jgi:hypothetical protein
MSQSTTGHDERQRYAEIAADQDLTAAEAALALFKQYARERPEVVALWSFGLGFALGWKLKIW